MAKRRIFKLNPSLKVYNNTYNSQLFADLGKSTRRGIKKCYNCGTYNGTRGFVCKNKNCNALFKGTNCDSHIDLGEPESVKLITGNSRQIFSVNVKEKGPHHRGFVQLPFNEDADCTNQKVALCFVDSCQRLFDNSILKCHEVKESNCLLDTFCPHVESAVKSIHVAKPLTTEKSTLDKLKISDDVKLELLQLFSESKGVLVQQVSKSIMAVKCHVSSKYPVGYLHFTILNNKKKDISDKYYCNCNQFRVDHFCGKDGRCIHYYACIWAFVNSPQLSKEFFSIISLEVPYLIDELSSLNQALYFFANNEKQSNKKKQKNSSNRKKEDQFRKKDHDLDNKLIETGSNFDCIVEKASSDIQTKQNVTEDLIGETCNMNFVDWLSSVTERINLSLCCENINKNYENLEFQIPEIFFIALKERINRGSEISKQSFLSNISFSQIEEMHHSYYIYSAHHLKEIFDTPHVSLCLVKTVVLNKSSVVMYLQVDRQQLKNNSNVFLIEWKPNILPTSKFGIISFNFKIGKFN